MNEETLASLCKALGNPVRLRILKQLLTEEQCICGRIVEVLPLAQSTVSQHLKILKDAGLIQGEVSGPKTCYCVNMGTLSQLGSTILSLLPTPEKGVSCE